MNPTDRHTLKQFYLLIWQDNCRRHPMTEPRLIASPKPYNLTKTNDLERAICKWFEIKGYKAERVKVQGRKLGSDVVTYNHITGKRQTLDKAKYIPTTGAKGSADISVTCRDKDGAVMSLRIEVKNGYTGDRVRPDQMKYKEQHEAAGGTYIIVRYFSEFIEWAILNVKQ